MRLPAFCRFLTIALAALLPGAGALGQDITLTRFTFSPESRQIGRIVPRASRPMPGKLKLGGPTARLFTIDRNHNLSFRKSLPAQQQSPWYEVVIRYKVRTEVHQDTFRVVQDQFLRNQVIAHRGAWKNTGATENSIAALQHAIRLGCAGSEFDVHLSADSVLFVLHDPKIQDIAIETTAGPELARLKLKNGESLPTLAAYLQEGVKQNKTRLVLEMKPSIVSKERSLALARATVALVSKYRAQGWVDYISFDYDILKQVLALDPYAKVAYLKGDVAPAVLARDKFYGLDYHFSVLQKNPDWLLEARRLGLTTNVWTVNDPALMDWFLINKADFITTNEPELLLEKVKQSQ
jgi:glycerophosphoryl diester phosphodiesterase